MMSNMTKVRATLQAVKIKNKCEPALYKLATLINWSVVLKLKPNFLRDLLFVHGDKDMLSFSMIQYQRNDAEMKRMKPTDVDMDITVILKKLANYDNLRQYFSFNSPSFASSFYKFGFRGCNCSWRLWQLLRLKRKHWSIRRRWLLRRWSLLFTIR